MRTLSSGLTFFYKRIFPAIFVGAIAFFILAGIFEGRARTIGFFIPPLAILGLGYAMWFCLLSEIADEVTDHGAFLLVRMGATKERIPLANIKDVRESINFNPAIMTLHLVQPCGFGDVISFFPYADVPFASWGKGKLDEILLQRADAARREPPVAVSRDRPQNRG